jgi:PAS domain-containing protein
VLALVLSASACGGDDSEFLFGENISGLTFKFFNENEGIHPSKVVLDNPRNPFRYRVISLESKFKILDSGGNAGAFYAWATLLAREPTGEHQYYTATKLRDIYDAREVEGADRERVRQMAIRGFQTVLDDFPDSVTVDVTTTQSFRLATPALMGILDLNGDVEGDWVLVLDDNGLPVAVKGAGL